MTAAQTRILLVLGALVAAVAIATAAVFFSGRDGTGSRAVAVRTATAAREGSVPAIRTATTAGPAASRTPTAGATAGASATVRRGVRVQSNGATNVRLGPGVSFPVMATLDAGDEARATGRNADGSWLLIEIPAGAGWIAAGVVEVVGDPLTLPLTDPDAARTATPAIVPFPTRTATAAPAASASRTATPTTTASPTIAAGGLPDLALQNAAVGAAGRLTLVIGNAGPGPLAGRRVSVIGIDETGDVVFGEVTPPLTIPPGGAVNVELSFRPAATGTLTVAINADGSVDELTNTNNRVRVTLGPR